jgi:hypothetical protein
VVEEREHARRVGRAAHLCGLGGVQRHRLFAEHGLAVRERVERHLKVRRGRRHDAHEIDFRMLDDLAPVAPDERNLKLARDRPGAFAARARNRHDPRALAGAKARYLRRTREARSDDADARRVSVSQQPSPAAKLIFAVDSKLMLTRLQWTLNLCQRGGQ